MLFLLFLSISLLWGQFQGVSFCFVFYAFTKYKTVQLRWRREKKTHIKNIKRVSGASAYHQMTTHRLIYTIFKSARLSHQDKTCCYFWDKNFSKKTLSPNVDSRQELEIHKCAHTCPKIGMKVKLKRIK